MIAQTPEKLQADIEKCQTWIEYVRAEQEASKQRFLAGEISAADYESECRENMTALLLLLRTSYSLLIEAEMMTADLGTMH